MSEELTSTFKLSELLTMSNAVH